MKRRPWTNAELATLRAKYQHMRTEDLARELGRNVRSVYNGAEQYGLRKSAEYLASPAACRLRRGGDVGKANRFKPGIVPWNAGMKGWKSGGRSAETQFRKGSKPHTWRPIGSERITDEGILQRKVTDTGCTRHDWKAVHVLLWESVNGPVPPGHICVFANRNQRDIRIENIECITRAENMRRNSYHRYGKEIARAVQLRGVLNRQINKRLRHAEQNG